jgi:hypothetical protein
MPQPTAAPQASASRRTPWPRAVFVPWAARLTTRSFRLTRATPCRRHHRYPISPVISMHLCSAKQRACCLDAVRSGPLFHEASVNIGTDLSPRLSQGTSQESCMRTLHLSARYSTSPAQMSLHCPSPLHPGYGDPAPSRSAACGPARVIRPNLAHQLVAELAVAADDKGFWNAVNALFDRGASAHVSAEAAMAVAAEETSRIVGLILVIDAD